MLDLCGRLGGCATRTSPGGTRRGKALAAPRFGRAWICCLRGCAHPAPGPKRRSSSRQNAFAFQEGGGAVASRPGRATTPYGLGQGPGARLSLAGCQARVRSCSVGPVPLALPALSREHWGRRVWVRRGARLRVPRQASPWHEKPPVLARGGDGSEITALRALLARQGPALLPSRVPSRGRVSAPSCLVASSRRLAPYPCVASHVRAGAPAPALGLCLPNQAPKALEDAQAGGVVGGRSHAG